MTVDRFTFCLDGRRASTILPIDELCSRSGGDAREAMTVGCKPTSFALSDDVRPSIRSG